jgi:hypothetical protein
VPIKLFSEGPSIKPGPTDLMLSGLRTTRQVVQLMINPTRIFTHWQYWRNHLVNAKQHSRSTPLRRCAPCTRGRDWLKEAWSPNSKCPLSSGENDKNPNGLGPGRATSEHRAVTGRQWLVFRFQLRGWEQVVANLRTALLIPKMPCHGPVCT